MKLYFAYIVSLLVGVQAFAFGPMDARKMYFEGWEGSCGATMLVDTLQQNEIKDDPVMMAYKGAALTTLANCKDTPFSKLSVFNKGKDLLETAIGMDAESVEARFLRYTVQTNIPGIYAIGDVNTKSMLAHAASRMGEVAVNNMFGRPDVMRYQAIPWVVYTMPEIASVGLTETQAAAQGIATQTASLPMTANGRFLAENEGKRGLWKVVVDAQTQALLGVHIIGAAASELIYGAAAMIEDEFRVQDIEEVVFPHPTVSELFKDTLFEIHI